MKEKYGENMKEKNPEGRSGKYMFLLTYNF